MTDQQKTPKVCTGVATTPPFGLDFDIPEKVWILVISISRASYPAMHGKAPELVACWASQDEAMASPRKLGIDGIARPAFVTPDYLRQLRTSEGVSCRGMALLDAEGSEIGRRYFR